MLQLHSFSCGKRGLARGTASLETENVLGAMAVRGLQFLWPEAALERSYSRSKFEQALCTLAAPGWICTGWRHAVRARGTSIAPSHPSPSGASASGVQLGIYSRRASRDLNLHFARAHASLCGLWHMLTHADAVCLRRRSTEANEPSQGRAQDGAAAVTADSDRRRPASSSPPPQFAAARVTSHDATPPRCRHVRSPLSPRIVAAASDRCHLGSPPPRIAATSDCNRLADRRRIGRIGSLPLWTVALPRASAASGCHRLSAQMSGPPRIAAASDRASPWMVAAQCWAGGTRPLILKIRSGRFPRFRVSSSLYTCVCPVRVRSGFRCRWRVAGALVLYGTCCGACVGTLARELYVAFGVEMRWKCVV